jgi:hypothetical protein
MKTRTIVTTGLLAIAAGVGIGATVLACDSGSDQTGDCNRGTLRLQVQLNLTASYADTVEVLSYAPQFDEKFSRTPNGLPGDLFNADVSFPGGYPADKLLTLLVRAYGQNQLIGESLAQIHTLPVCTVGGVTIAPHTLDAAPNPTDGGTD